MQVFLIALGLVAVLVAVGVFGHHPDTREERIDDRIDTGICIGCNR